MTSTTTRTDKVHITPDQADYRGHVLFDRSTGQNKEKMVRRMSPHQIISLFTTNIIQQKIVR
jgi:hypothetical protein